ncbi:MAG: type II secretion system protein [Desulfobacterales bacterium]|jgi:prepilin-type N-terminal cleavage/methylation domain-containing protein
MIAKMIKKSMVLNDKRGFTMIELSVVLAILGLLTSMAVKSFMDSRTHVRDAVALAETRGLGKAVIDAFLEGDDVDLTHNPGDGHVIGSLDTSGNSRKSVFALSPGMQALIIGSSDFGGTGKGSCEAWISHPNGSKTYYLLIDEVNNITSFPGI